jgi:2-oxo-3-hexenedioate decarboxylase
MAGYKAGLTSHAKMEQMGVEEPVFGFITDVGEIPMAARSTPRR